MNVVYSINQAMDWFLENHELGVTCHALNGKEKYCESFVEAKAFFEENPGE